MTTQLKDCLGPATFALYQQVFLQHGLKLQLVWQPEHEPLSLSQRSALVAQHIGQALEAGDTAVNAPLLISLIKAVETARQHPHISVLLHFPFSDYLGQLASNSPTTNRATGAMSVQHVLDIMETLTSVFTAEFCLRPFLEKHLPAVTERLNTWIHSPNVHLRRLVSESTRPRLPWAARLEVFQHDYTPVLGWLEVLAKDEALYVRKSVANHLNDLSNSAPALLLGFCRQLQLSENSHAPWIIKNALRTLIKQGHTEALALIGAAATPEVTLLNVRVPRQATIGETIRIAFDLVNLAATERQYNVDLVCHYCKAGGQSSRKVFKIGNRLFPSGGKMTLGKNISLKQMTTRTHYPGTHVLELLVNGTILPLGSFNLAA